MLVAKNDENTTFQSRTSGLIKVLATLELQTEATHAQKNTLFSTEKYSHNFFYKQYRNNYCNTHKFQIYVICGRNTKNMNFE